MNNDLIVYLAGCLDCDGSFGIYRNTTVLRVPNAKAKSPQHTPRIIFKQVRPEIVNLLHETFGGRKAFEKSHHPRHKDIYSWSATLKTARNCIIAVLPYLRIKKEQAQLLLQLCDRQRNRNYTLTGRVKKLTDEELIERDKLHAAVKALNDTRIHKPKLM